MAQKNNKSDRCYPISWEQIHRDSKILSWRLLALSENWKGIVAVTRGGLIPAGIVACELDIHYVDTVCISSYTWLNQGHTTILKSLDQNKGNGWLIIDDLVDTDKTAEVVRNMLPDAHFASVYVKTDGKQMVDTYVTEVSQDTWIVFPWEMKTDTLR